MDGLRGLIDKKGTIGRKVGNVLSLALDEEVSGRHAEVLKEGHDWCVRDLNSTNGTFLMNEKLQVGRSYPVKMDDILLVGSSIVQLNQGKAGEECLPFSESSFSDPRTTYTMTPGLNHVWNSLFRFVEEDNTIDRYFCDVDRLFVAMMESAAEISDAGYDCVSQVKAPGRYQIFGKWLAKASVGEAFKGQPGTLTVATRVWRVMSLAAERKQGTIGIGDILGAILEDGGSLAARYMRKDKKFMEDFGPKLRRGASDRTVIDIVRTPRKGPEPAVQQPPAPSRQAVAAPQAAPAPVNDPWKVFGQRLERLVLGFLADAINPVATQQEFRPPGLTMKLEEVLAASAGDPNLLDQRVKHYLDTIYNLLVVILASQHDGYKFFAEALCTMLESTVAEKKDGRSLMLPLGKKSVDIEELLVKIKAVRRRVENEGVSETIVRDIIKKKIQQLGL
jgi:pSer/pThr/pTyr-binding forkhead associated (FHA) protein